MEIKQLQTRVLTEVRDYINAHNTGDKIDLAPLTRMIEIHFENLNAQVDVQKFVQDSVGGLAQYFTDQMKKKANKKDAIKRLPQAEMEND
jgi:hypothetical protein